MWSEGGGYDGAETSRNGDRAWVKMACGEYLNEGGEVGPLHREVAGKDMAEALVELGLNNSNERGRHVLLHRRLYLGAGVDFVCGFKERREFEHCRVAFLRTEQDRYHEKPLL